MIRNTLVLALTAFFVLACDRGDRSEIETPPVDESAQAALFDRIDADSIYLMANLEPLPEDLSNKFWSVLEPMAESNQQVYSQAAEAIGDPLASALLLEIAAIDSRQAFEARGLHGNGLWAIHSLALYPVVHWQLVDADAFRATLDRVAADAGTELPWRGIGDEQVLWIDLGDFSLAVHSDEHFVTAALVPDDLALLRRVANLDQPATAFRTRDLVRFNRDRGYAPQGSGYFDFSRLIERLLDADDELAVAARQVAGMGALVDDPACADELTALASTFPRMSTGYTRITNRDIDFSIRLETDSTLGEKLARIADTPVNLQGEHSGLFSGGLAFNLIAARDLGREIVGGWVDNPPQCELFAHIRENAADWQLALNRPIPPIVTNIHGFRFNIARFEAGGETGIGDAAGTLAVFMRNPQMLIGMAQMFSPELAALDLRPGGEPKPLPAGMIPNMPEGQAFIAMGSNSIGLAMGEDQKGRLGDALDPGKADSSVLRYRLDFAAYGEMLSAMMDRTRAQLEAANADFDMPPTDDMFGQMAEVYEYSDQSLLLTPQAIEFTTSIRMRD